MTLNYSPPKRLKESFKIRWDSDEIKYLGVYITKGIDKLYNANYSRTNQEINKDLRRWSLINLDLSSKIEVVKMNILPRLLYLFQSLPIQIPQNQFREWDKLISRFIWGGEKTKS